MSSPPQEPTPHAPSPPPPPTPHGAAQTVLSFLGQAASREAREAQAEASAAVPTVLGSAQNMLSRLTSSSIPQATSYVQQRIPDVFQEHVAEASVPSEVPQRAAERASRGPPPTSASSHSGGSNRERPITPPPGVARVTRSYPAVPDATHQPRPPRAPQTGLHRRMTGLYGDSETAWNPYDDKDPVRP